ncbi:hypothetical protein OIU77_007630 [Salix suchowensis]|uniref:Uncharacterized protein n=1 Tax=Salix suchowensis TaxID=1278906 RepID=A0ABQ9AI01_9ROSI|nr:hypothetical protein OIU77_007630 [Salix suchowensis]
MLISPSTDLFIVFLAHVIWGITNSGGFHWPPLKILNFLLRILVRSLFLACGNAEAQKNCNNFQHGWLHLPKYLRICSFYNLLAIGVLSSHHLCFFIEIC